MTDPFIDEDLTEIDQIGFECEECGFISSEQWDDCPNCKDN
jgi:rubrerythrin